MGSGKGKTRRALTAQGGAQDNYEAQRAAFTAKIESACANGSEEALEQVLEEIDHASQADLQQLEKSATADDIFDATLAWASLTNDAMQRFYVGS